MLKVEGLTRKFDGLTAVEDVSMFLSEPGAVAIIGPNGSGKTTVLNLLFGLVRADSGSIRIMDREVSSWEAHEIARLGVARTFQDLRLPAALTCFEIVTLCVRSLPGERLFDAWFKPLRISRMNPFREKVAELLNRVGLYEEINTPASKLSYGQKKLLALAGCIAADASLLLLDEPVAGVQPAIRDQVLEMLLELPQEGRLILLVEHDLEAVARVAGHVVLMSEGRIVTTGPCEAVLNSVETLKVYID